MRAQHGDIGDNFRLENGFLGRASRGGQLGGQDLTLFQPE